MQTRTSNIAITLRVVRNFETRESPPNKAAKYVNLASTASSNPH